MKPNKKVIFVLSASCNKSIFSRSVKRGLRAEAGLAVVALCGVRGALPHHALCQRLPLLGYDLLTLQVSQTIFCVKILFLSFN